MKKSLLLFHLLLLLGATPLLAAETKLGFVDLQKALSLCEEGKAAREELSKKEKEYQAQLDQKKSKIMKLQEDYKKSSLLLSAEARAVKEDELGKELDEYRGAAESNQLSLQKKHNELSKKIIEGLVESSNALGVKDGYTIILEKSSVVFFADPSLDLTDKVIKAYDATRKK